MKSLADLKDWPPRLLPALLQAMHDKEVLVRAAAAEALGRAGKQPQVVTELKAAVRDPKISGTAVGSLAKLDAVDDAVIRDLIDGLFVGDSYNNGAHTRAAAAFAKLGPAGKSAVPLLVAELKSAHEEHRQWAAMALGHLGALAAPALPALVEALRDGNPSVRDAASFGLRQYSGTVRNRLAELLRDENADTRALAMGVLGSTGQQARFAVPAMIEALQDKNEKVRLAAVQALGHQGAVNGVLGAVLPLMKDPDKLVAAAAGRAVDDLAKHNAEAATVLVPALRDENIEVRRVAATALGAATGNRPEVSAALGIALADPAASVRIAAAITLVSLTPADTRLEPILLEGLQHKDGIPPLCVRALGQLTGPTAAVLPALLATWRRGEGYSASEVLRQLATRDAQVVPAVLKLTEEKDEKIRARATALLASLGQAAPVVKKARLRKLLDDTDPYVAAAAAGGLLDIVVEKDLRRSFSPPPINYASWGYPPSWSASECRVLAKVLDRLSP